MNILLDQNISIEILYWLKNLNPKLKINHTSQVGLSNKTDKEIFVWAQKEKAIIITFDEDFADQRSFPVGKHFGVIRLRIWPTTVEETQGALLRLFQELEPKEIQGSLVIIDKSKIRIRKI